MPAVRFQNAGGNDVEFKHLKVEIVLDPAVPTVGEVANSCPSARN